MVNLLLFTISIVFNVLLFFLKIWIQQENFIIVEINILFQKIQSNFYDKHFEKVLVK